MKLELKIFKTKDLAEWFGVKPETIYRNREKWLEKLSQYCEFEDLGKKGVKIIDIHITEYIKEPTAYSIAHKYFEESWAVNGENLNTCSRTAEYMYNTHSAEITVKPSTLYNATCIVKNELYGSSMKSSKKQ